MEQIPQTIERLREAFKTGKTRPIEFRLHQLKRIVDLLTENEQEICTALQNDLRKCKPEVQVMEIMMVKNDIADVYANLEDWMQPQYVDKDLANKTNDCTVRYDPLGVTLIIGAWNYPLQLTLLPLVGAIAAGNCAVIKPSEVAVHTAEIVEKLLPRYLDKDCFAVINGGIPETTALLENKFDLIFYTGNSFVGKIVMKAAAKYLTPVVLELGGKSPCFIDEDCDVATAARRIAWGKYANSGQTCIAPDYCLCPPSIQSQLVDEMKKAVKEFYGEDPKTSPYYSRIINERHFKRLSTMMNKGDIVIGGEMDAAENYIAPTVITGVTEHDPIMQEEIFGPIFPIINVKNADEAVEFINEREKPLALYAFSNKRSVIDKMMNETTSGGFCGNDTLMHAGLNTMPFGGVGNSGTGSYHGKFTFEAFSHKKACLVKKLNMEMLNSVRYPPYTEKKLSWLFFLMGKSLKRKSRAGSLMCLVFLGALVAVAVKVFGMSDYIMKYIK